MSWKRACYLTSMVIVHLVAAGCSSESPSINRNNDSGVSAAPATPEPQQEGLLVLAFGDSLYAGYGLAPHQSFPAQLEKALRLEGLVATVHNAGVSGETSAAGLQRLAFTLDGLSRKPDLALVGLGANDMLRGLDPAATRANLLAICTELRRRDIDVMLTGMLAAPNLGQDYSRRFNRIFPEVASSCGATLYPFFLDGVIAQPQLMLPDRIHPNSAGIQRIVGSMKPAVARELREKQPPSD